MQTNLTRNIATSMQKHGHSVGIENQLWIDRIPDTEKDKMNLFAIIKAEKIGVYQAASEFEGDYSIFFLESLDDKTVSIKMGQTDKKHKISYKVRPTTGKELGDFALEVSGHPRGPKSYFTLNEWELGSSQDLEVAIEFLDAAVKTGLGNQLFDKTCPLHHNN